MSDLRDRILALADTVENKFGIETHIEGARNAIEAIACIESALLDYDLEQGWHDEEWETLDDPLPPSKPTLVQEGDTTVWQLPPVSDEVKAARRQWASDYRLNETCVPPGPDYEDAYVKGGPEWLYGSDREFVLSLPDAAKRGMIADYMARDLHKEANALAADLLRNDASDMESAPPLGDTYKGKGSKNWL